MMFFSLVHLRAEEGTPRTDRKKVLCVYPEIPIGYQEPTGALPSWRYGKAMPHGAVIPLD